ncbi:hypothetical protein [Sulfitobacter aestuariivivens]|uniref:Uncharacterized protein n=1 Tax=Sulfitobacter aestuariivivens TaxID=2766981 RepID=A0A927HDK8_9RHOB|nr:hypothetical protein [Sulfitobacter aestuariivivens]MBD3662453.1 hypothetical protein [Sulfitobacter aestuariivivens]
MTYLRTGLIAMCALLATYTLIVVFREGTGLVAVFFGDLISVTWRGQFNLDFACYLMLSALWVAWRSGFKAAGIFTALIASVVGMLFFAPLVLVYASRASGDLKKLLLGVHASS